MLAWSPIAARAIAANIGALWRRIYGSEYRTGCSRRTQSRPRRDATSTARFSRSAALRSLRQSDVPYRYRHSRAPLSLLRLPHESLCGAVGRRRSLRSVRNGTTTENVSAFPRCRTPGASERTSDIRQKQWSGLAASARRKGAMPCLLRSATSLNSGGSPTNKSTPEPNRRCVRPSTDYTPDGTAD
jgi:hypothetical protein